MNFLVKKQVRSVGQCLNQGKLKGEMKDITTFFIHDVTLVG